MFDLGGMMATDSNTGDCPDPSLYRIGLKADRVAHDDAALFELGEAILHSGPSDPQLLGQRHNRGAGIVPQ
ncbi:hypothetical protein D9M73_220440 [compost metagenome]